MVNFKFTPLIVSGMAAANRFKTDELDTIDQDAVEIIATASEGDKVLFNDRVYPLTVNRVSGLKRRTSSKYASVWLIGPQGGKYRLTYRESRGQSTVSLERHTGYDDGIRQTEEMPLSNIEFVEQHTFTIGQVFEVVESVWDEYYHVVTAIPDSGTYDVETVGIRASEGEVIDSEERGLFRRRAKERLFNGQLELVEELSIGYGGRGRHYDTERGEAIRLSGPHKRGVDLRPVDGSGLEVVDWETILFNFEDRFQPAESETRSDS